LISMRASAGNWPDPRPFHHETRFPAPAFGLRRNGVGMNGSRSFPTEGIFAAAALTAAAFLGILMPTTGGLALAIPLAIAGGVLLFVNPLLGMLLLVGTIPLESALMLGGRSAPALLGMAVVGTWGVRKLLYRESLTELVAPGLVRLGLLLFAFACLSVTWAEYPQGLERPLILLLQLMLLAVLISDLASTRDRMVMVAKVLVLAGVVAAVLTAEQYFVGGVRRAGAGITGGINRTAITLVTIVPFAFYLLRSQEHSFWRLLGLGYVGLSAVAVAVTLSRMNYLVLPLVVLLHLGFMARTRVGRRRVLLLGAAVALAVSFLPMDTLEDRALSIVPYLHTTVGSDETGGTVSGRGYHLRIGLEIFRDHPIIGAGYRNYNPQFLTYQWQLPGTGRIYQSPRSPHSSHMAFLANLGIIGFSLWIGLFLLGFRYVFRAWRSVEDKGSSEAFMVQAVGIALGLQSIYGLYGEIHQDKIFWVVIGMVLALSVVSRSGRRGQVSPEQAPGPSNRIPA